MVTDRGTHEGRPVTCFQVIDPAIVPLTGLDLWNYHDLDPRPIVYSGHLERDGSVVVHGLPGSGLT